MPREPNYRRTLDTTSFTSCQPKTCSNPRRPLSSPLDNKVFLAPGCDFGLLKNDFLLNSILDTLFDVVPISSSPTSFLSLAFSSFFLWKELVKDIGSNPYYPLSSGGLRCPGNNFRRFSLCRDLSFLIISSPPRLLFLLPLLTRALPGL